MAFSTLKFYSDIQWETEDQTAFSLYGWGQKQEEHQLWPARYNQGHQTSIVSMLENLCWCLFWFLVPEYE